VNSSISTVSAELGAVEVGLEVEVTESLAGGVVTESDSAVGVVALVSAELMNSACDDAGVSVTLASAADEEIVAPIGSVDVVS